MWDYSYSFLGLLTWFLILSSCYWGSIMWYSPFFITVTQDHEWLPQIYPVHTFTHCNPWGAPCCVTTRVAAPSLGIKHQAVIPLGCTQGGRPQEEWLKGSQGMVAGSSFPMVVSRKSCGLGCWGHSTSLNTHFGLPSPWHCSSSPCYLNCLLTAPWHFETPPRS